MNIVFIRNSDEDFCTLLITLLPSATTFGRLAKSESIKTIEDIKTLLIIKKSDRGALSESYRDISKESEQVLIWLKEIEENNECVTVGQLKIDGNDLIKLGFKNEEIGGKKYADGYDCAELAKTFEEEIPITTYNTLLYFFLLTSLNSIRAMQIYSELALKQVERETGKTLTEERKKLRKIADTFGLPSLTK